MADLTMHRGDTRQITVTLDDENTFAEGDTVWFTAKRSQVHADADAVIAKVSPTSVAFTAGQATASATIAPADTVDLTRKTTLVYDWQLLTAGGVLSTIESGRLTIEADVTRAITAP